MEVREASAQYLPQHGSELPSGHKKTEAGVIPEDWKLATLGEICVFENGDRSSNYPSGSDFVPSGVPFVNAGHVEHGKLNLSLMDYIRPDVYARLTRGKLREGDILYCLRGSLGKYGIVPAGFGDGAIASSLVIVRPKIAAIDRQFLLCYFESNLCTQMIETWSGGAAQPNLGVQDLARFYVALPPTKAEQEAIAEALSDADALVESLEQLLAKKRQLKQGAMQELLAGKKRLPDFSGEWEVKRLGEICYMKSGEGITSENIDEYSEFPCYGGNGLRGFTKRATHDGSYALIGRQGALCGNVVNVDGKFFASEHAIVVTPHKETDIHWLSRILERMNLNQYSESSAQPGLSVAKLLALECEVPPLAEQTAIATILSDMEAEIVAQEEKLAKARAIKQGMMQELLTGRIRLV